MRKWTEAQRAELASLGRDPQHVEEQIQRLTRGLPRLPMLRPATLGDGITSLDGETAAVLDEAATTACAAGRVSAFVPASGAATRMAKALVMAHGASAPLDDATAAWLGTVRTLALGHALTPVADHPQAWLDALVGKGGFGLQHQPKALVPFHLVGGVPRTALEGQLRSAAELMAGSCNDVTVHMTASPEHRDGFAAVLASRGAAVAEDTGVKVHLTLSVQDPATDTVALDDNGALFRRDDGTLLLRPGGHGALLHNLNACDADLMTICNIDNVAHPDHRPAIIARRRQLVGLLALVQAEAWSWVARLRAGEPVGPEVQAWVAQRLGISVASTTEALLHRLNRPWRVVGMVPVSGEPGGGPFWVDGPEGPTLQIVEGAQMQPDQVTMAACGTHFNPVDMVVGLRGADGQRFDLMAWRDPDAVILADKSYEGRALRALEHPGLWNGGMARWNTIFVELPAYAFNPVKTAHDLSRVRHLPRG